MHGDTRVIYKASSLLSSTYSYGWECGGNRNGSTRRGGEENKVVGDEAEGSCRRRSSCSVFSHADPTHAHLQRRDCSIRAVTVLDATAATAKSLRMCVNGIEYERSNAEQSFSCAIVSESQGPTFILPVLKEK
ncbi:hypothetical protein EYF80_042221 [Liparis tanakae]|uniref:Uncharacterized protein n=1 Tax=Liparis tanakae TaxID=230148 RepID=A0A4Z2G213_9TELE|nr:hypothetical protein EYF80_042221 [Liparis tanakae]